MEKCRWAHTSSAAHRIYNIWCTFETFVLCEFSDGFNGHAQRPVRRKHWIYYCAKIFAVNFLVGLSCQLKCRSRFPCSTQQTVQNETCYCGSRFADVSREHVRSEHTLTHFACHKFQHIRFEFFIATSRLLFRMFFSTGLSAVDVVVWHHIHWAELAPILSASLFPDSWCRLISFQLCTH